MGEFATIPNARQAFRIGRARLVAGIGVDAVTGKPLTPVPVEATVTLQNNGEVQWPATTVAALVEGDGLGQPLLSLGAVRPGDVAEIIMDLEVPMRVKPGMASSMWAILDATTGNRLGPVLIFETVWVPR